MRVRFQINSLQRWGQGCLSLTLLMSCPFFLSLNLKIPSLIKCCSLHCLLLGGGCVNTPTKCMGTAASTSLVWSNGLFSKRIVFVAPLFAPAKTAYRTSCTSPLCAPAKTAYRTSCTSPLCAPAKTAYRTSCTYILSSYSHLRYVKQDFASGASLLLRKKHYFKRCPEYTLASVLPKSFLRLAV